MRQRVWRRAEHVPRVEGREAHALVLQRLVVVDELDLVHAREHVLLVEEPVVVVADLDRVVGDYFDDEFQDTLRLRLQIS